MECHQATMLRYVQKGYNEGVCGDFEVENGGWWMQECWMEFGLSGKHRAILDEKAPLAGKNQNCQVRSASVRELEAVLHRSQHCEDFWLVGFSWVKQYNTVISMGKVAHPKSTPARVFPLWVGDQDAGVAATEFRDAPNKTFSFTCIRTAS